MFVQVWLGGTRFFVWFPPCNMRALLSRVCPLDPDWPLLIFFSKARRERGILYVCVFFFLHSPPRHQVCRSSAYPYPVEGDFSVFI
jgi:hypothetical protein